MSNHQEHQHGHDSEPNPEAFWEEKYNEADRVWSGKVNKVLADFVGQLPPGRALDLGCGEGADVIWLASQGWQATGIDISPTAIARATQIAADSGLSTERVHFTATDLSNWQSDQTYDLVTASFLQAHFEFPRGEIIRAARDRVAPGGHLLVVSHAAFPTWSSGPSHGEILPTPESELDMLDLAAGDWTVITADVLTRPVTGPSGEQGDLADTVIFARRGQ